jgi:phosphoenolpyruvate carboxylase
MATTTDDIDALTEECSVCDRTTPHSVTVTILTESSRTENAEYSREPYRISECQVCGAVERTRMNNA